MDTDSFNRVMDQPLALGSPYESRRTCSCTVYAHTQSKTFTLKALVDTGCSGYLYLNPAVARLMEQDGAHRTPLYEPKEISDYRQQTIQKLTHEVNAVITFGSKDPKQAAHVDFTAPLTIADMGRRYDLFIGLDYMQRFGLTIDCGRMTLRFDRPNRLPLTVMARAATDSITPAEEAPSPWVPPGSVTIFQRPSAANPQARPRAQATPITLSSRTSSRRDKAIARLDKERTKEEDRQEKLRLLEAHTAKFQSRGPDVKPISARAYKKMARKHGVENCSIFLVMKEDPLADTINHVAREDLDAAEAQRNKPETDPRTVVPKEYHDYLYVFSKAASDKLPGSRPTTDFKIELLPGIKPEDLGYTHLRRASEAELAEVKRYVREGLDKGFLEVSKSGMASPILLVRKPGGGVRFCVDFRKLNNMTRKDRYPIPLLDETIGQIKGAKYLTRLDIRQAFHRIKCADEATEDLLTFRTRFGAYKYKVMPFGVANGPATWQRLINECLFKFLGEFATAYLDDILIYSKTLVEHRRHVRAVLEKLGQYGLQADVDKCEFDVRETKFLGMMVSTSGLRMDPQKTAAISSWQAPQNTKDVRAFLGLVNFYRRFIGQFSTIARPMNNLLKKDAKWDWTAKEQQSFEDLKQAVCTAPVLQHFDPTRRTIVETDSSDWTMGGVLSQYDDQQILRPVAYYSKNLCPAEVNYPIYDKELLAIVTALEQWRAELHACQDVPFTVFTDHQTLHSFLKTKELKRRQVRWAYLLSEYDFEIVYRKGSANTKADALTRRSQDKPREGDKRLCQQNRALLQPQHFSEDTRSCLERENPTLLATITEEIVATEEMDSPAKTIAERVLAANRADTLEMKELRAQATADRESACELRKGLLFMEDRLYVPEALRAELLRHIHEQPAVGHPGRNRMWNLVCTRYYFPGVQAMIKRLVEHCDVCCKTRKMAAKTSGLLQPIPIPDRPWQDIAMDFIGPLPTDRKTKHNTIFVVCDLYSKSRHFIPLTGKQGGTDSITTAKALLQNVVSVRGLPRSIISDQGPQFVAQVWKDLMKIMKTQVKLTAPYHPQTDGQTERANQDLKNYLRKFVNHYQDDWTEWLPLAQLAANSLPSEPLGNQSPFEVCHGYPPRMDFDIEDSTPADSKPITDAAARMAHRFQRVWDMTRDALVLAKARQAVQANKQRAPHQVRVGEQVYISAAHLTTGRPRALDWKRIGPYKVLETRGNWAVLDMPNGSRVTNKFNVERLMPAGTNPLPGQNYSNDPPIIIDDEVEWIPDKILEARLKWGKILQFQVQWKGYPTGSEWYNADEGQFDHDRDRVLQFYRDRKPGVRLPKGWQDAAIIRTSRPTTDWAAPKPKDTSSHPATPAIDDLARRPGRLRRPTRKLVESTAAGRTPF